MARRITQRAEILPALAEVFREYGFEGATLSLIGERAGLGKGSLYHFFPGGKDEMAAAVLAEIGAWFETTIFRPLREDADPMRAIRSMFRSVDAYFQAGRRVCLVGAFALSDARDRFAAPIRGYFARWNEALREALLRAGLGRKAAWARAESILAGIQGALVLARALGDPGVFRRALAAMRDDLASEQRFAR